MRGSKTLRSGLEIPYRQANAGSRYSFVSNLVETNVGYPMRMG